MKRLFLTISISTALSLCSIAQSSFESFRNKAITQYESFRNKAQDDYEAYRKKCNDDYANFLRNAWNGYKAMQSPVLPEFCPLPPKPYKDDGKPIEDNEKKIDEIIVPKQEVPETQPKPVAPIKEIGTPVIEHNKTVINDNKKNIIPEQNEHQWHHFTSFGTQMKVRLAKNIQFKLADVSENSIADGWKKLSSEKYNNLIIDCLDLREKLCLCDWAYLRMLKDMSTAYFGTYNNEATLMLAYVFCQSGYKIRLAQDSRKLYLLYASHHTMYGSIYFNINGTKFYPIDCNEKNLYICNATFPNETPLSLFINSEPKFAIDKADRINRTSKQYPQMSLNLSANKNLINFYNTYPQSEIDNNFMTKWAMYAQTPLSKNAKDEIYPAIKAIFKGKSELEAANILLNWIQTGFVYKLDNEVWGADRPFFADETLAYPYCDCEDRSILFTRIIRDILHLDVILVYYPGHLATAVKFNQDVKGDYIRIGNEKFVICDPTFIGAPAGRTMTGMNNSKAKIIRIK